MLLPSALITFKGTFSNGQQLKFMWTLRRKPPELETETLTQFSLSLIGIVCSLSLGAPCWEYIICEHASVCVCAHTCMHTHRYSHTLNISNHLYTAMPPYRNKTLNTNTCLFLKHSFHTFFLAHLV